MRKNAVQEAAQTGFATIKHVGGKIEPFDIFAKEDKDTAHYLTLSNTLMSTLMFTSSDRESTQRTVVISKFYKRMTVFTLTPRGCCQSICPLSGRKAR
eukprot:9051335-Ditylum_brightwellii.AAC.1